MDLDLHTSKTKMQLNMAATLVLVLSRSRHVCRLQGGSSSSRGDRLVCPALMSPPALFQSLFSFSKHGLRALSFASYGKYKVNVP